MMEEQTERFEDELRRLAPAPPPPRLMDRLLATRPPSAALRRTTPRQPGFWPDWLAGWRSLVIATPALALIVVWLTIRPAPIEQASASGIQANAVQVDHSLVAAFDTVARLPGGEPVRFRCREWKDDVVVHDDAQGVVISQSTPRFEVVPIRFETY